MATTKSLRTAVALVAILCSGCMSLTTNTTVLSDSSHLGTPYSGTRADLHILWCFGRDVSREPYGLVFTPLMLFPVIDLPLSFVLDTALLPLDLLLEPDRPPKGVVTGGCRLIGM